MWIIFSLLSILFYTSSSFFTKKRLLQGDENGEWSTLLYANLTGAIYSFILSTFNLSESGLSPISLVIKYPLVLAFLIPSAMYVVFDVLSIKFLPLSKCTPLINLASIVAFILTIIIFLVSGIDYDYAKQFTPIRIIALLMTIYGVYKIYTIEKTEVLSDVNIASLSRKLLIIGYVFVTIAVIADATDIAVSSFAFAATDLGERDVMSLYGFTSFILAIGLYIYLFIKDKKLFNIFNIKNEKYALLFSLCNLGATYTYVLAQSLSPVFAPILIYSTVIFEMSVGLVYFKEKLSKNHLVALMVVIIAIILFGISEVI